MSHYSVISRFVESNRLRAISRTCFLAVFSIIAVAPAAYSQSFTEGFNNSVTNVTVSGGAYYSGSSAAGDRPASTTFANEGTHSYGVTNATATITSSAINTLGATGLSLSFKLASFSIGSTGNGADAADVVTVAISPDNGTTWYDTVQVAGNSNAFWSFSSGAGSASTAYDGNSTAVVFAPAAGGTRTTDGYSTVTVTGLPQAASLKFRITMLNNATAERWLVDSLSFSGTFTFAPLMATGTATSVTSTGATLGGNITSSGGSDATVRGFYYSTSDGFADGAGTAISSTGTFSTGTYSESPTGLSPGTTYYFKAFATNTTGTGYGTQATFSTLPDAPSTPTASLVTSSGFTASWGAVTGATSYRLDAATDSGFTTLLPSYSNLSVAGTSQALTGLDPSTLYYVRVRAVGAGGTGANSATLSQTTDVATEPALVATPASASAFTYAYAAGPSTSQPFTVSGLNLTPAADNVTVSAASSDYEVSTDNTTFSSSVLLPYTGGTLGSTTVHVRLKAGLTVGSYNSQTVSVSGGGSSTTKTVTVSGSVTIATPPTLTAAGSASVDAPFDVTFTDNATWRGNITGVTINGTPLTAGYSVSAGTLTFTPSASVPASLLQSSGSKTISVLASNYSSDDVTQAISAGAATHLTITTQPGAPATNGATLGTQPVLSFRDQFNNPTVSTDSVTATVGSGTWTLGGTVTVAAVSGTATFTDLTATSPAAVTGATIVFSSGALTAATSNGFNIPTPPPANDNPAGAIELTPNSSVISGDLSGSAPLSPSTKKDVWFKFTAVGPVATVTINNFAPVGNKDLYVYSALPTSYSTTTDVVGSGITTSTTTESAIASGLTAGNTYYILVQDVLGTGATFDIGVANPPSAPTSAAATAITSTSFTANWGSVTGATGYKVDVYKLTPVVTTDLIISEYIEGSSNNKYIEIYNGTGATVNLSNYELRLLANGASTVTSTQVLSTLSGGPTTLANGASLVLKNSGATLTLPSGVTAYTCSPVNFNGDDALGLYKVSSSAYIDIFGRIGDDPGAAWTSSSPALTTVDKTLRRKTTVTTGIATSPTGTGPTAFTTLSTEWEQFDIDSVSDLGSHGPLKTYLSGFTNADAGTATSLAVTGAAPNTEYRYVVRATNGTASSSNSAEQSVTTLDVVPVVTTGSAGTPTRVSVDITGSTMSSTGSAITERGVAYGTSTDPTIAGTKVVVSGTTGSFDAALTGLTPGQAYFARAYATNGAGTSYGDNVTFTTNSNQLPIFTGLTVSATTSVALPIATSSVVANASDADADTITVVSVGATSANGGTAVLSGGTITYTSAAAFTGSDSFTVTLSDGFGTATGTITVDVTGTTEDPLFTNPSNNAQLSDLSGGSKRLSFTGLPGRTYGIQRSSNLTGWTQIGTVTAPGSGPTTFDDPSPLADKGFYRIVYPAAP